MKQQEAVQGGTMEKVASSQYYMGTAVPSASTLSANALEKSSMIRGHHSSINKAVEAHRQLVEQRQSRQGRRDVEMMDTSSPDLALSQQIGSSSDTSSANSNSGYNAYENTLIESPATQAKMSSIQSFQTTEPDRPVMGEPVPKGSYLDVEI